MPTQKPRITDPRFLIIPETRKTDGRTLDCTGFPEKKIAKRSCSWYNPQCARSNIGMSPSGKAPDFDSGIRRFKSGHPSQHDPLAQLAEQLPFKQWVRGSNPRRVTKTLKALGLSGFFVSSLISTRPTAETSISEKGSGSDLWQKSECKWLKKVGNYRKSFLAL